MVSVSHPAHHRPHALIHANPPGNGDSAFEFRAILLRRQRTNGRVAVVAAGEEFGGFCPWDTITLPPAVPSLKALTLIHDCNPGFIVPRTGSLGFPQSRRGPTGPLAQGRGVSHPQHNRGAADSGARVRRIDRAFPGIHHCMRSVGWRDPPISVFFRRLAAPCASGDSEFRIRDSRFRNHSPSGIRNLESGIPMGLRLQAASESSSVGSLAVRASGDSEFRIRDSRFRNHAPSGIRNRESGIPIGLRPQAALRITNGLVTTP